MQVCSRLRLRLDLTSHSSILATAAEGPADGVTDGPSIHSLSAEHVGHCPLDTTHSPYDVV